MKTNTWFVSCLVFITAALLNVSTLIAAEGKTEAELKKMDQETLDAVVGFLKSKVEDIVLHEEPNSFCLDGGKKISDMQAQLVYENVIRTETGLKFDRVWTADQKIYNSKLGSDGLPIMGDDDLPVRGELWKDVHKRSVNQCHVRVAESTGELIGVCFGKEHNIINPTGYGRSIKMNLEGDVLKIKMTTILYSDYYGEGRMERYPGNSDSFESLEVQDGKLVYKEVIYSFIYDPKTETRKPKMIKKKVDGKEVEEQQIIRGISREK